MNRMWLPRLRGQLCFWLLIEMTVQVVDILAHTLLSAETVAPLSSVRMLPPPEGKHVRPNLAGGVGVVECRGTQIKLTFCSCGRSEGDELKFGLGREEGRQAVSVNTRRDLWGL